MGTRRAPGPPTSVDVAVIGGGIVGCAAAAMLAERGASVVLVEEHEIGAGASGRNLGAVQYPFDPVLEPLYVESVERYAALAAEDLEFSIPSTPVGLLLLNRDEAAARAQAARMARVAPDLEPEYLDPEAVSAAEPSLAPGPAAVRLETGYPIPPASATQAWGRLATRRGARLVIGSAARPTVEGGGVSGVSLDDGSRITAGVVLVAAGPWSPTLVDAAGGWAPIRRTWGVTVQLTLGRAAPHHILEEDEVDAVNRAAAATARAAAAEPDEVLSLFSIASAAGTSTLGTTFLATEPDPDVIAPILVERGAAFLPAIARAPVVQRRICARPQSVDGRPFIGPVAGSRGLHVCAGHGPWGISTGPASASIAVRAILDGTPPPEGLAATRVS